MTAIELLKKWRSDLSVPVWTQPWFALDSRSLGQDVVAVAVDALASVEVIDRPDDPPARLRIYEAAIARLEGESKQ